MSIDLQRQIDGLADLLERLRKADGTRGVRARVYRTTDQTLTTAVTASITFDAERYDTDALHSLVSNTSRFTIPYDGTYMVGGCVRFASNATGQRTLAFLLTNTSVLAEITVAANGGGVTELALATVYACVTGDYIEMRCTQNSGGNLAVSAAAAISPEFWIEKLIA